MTPHRPGRRFPPRRKPGSAHGPRQGQPRADQTRRDPREAPFHQDPAEIAARRRSHREFEQAGEKASRPSGSRDRHDRHRPGHEAVITLRTSETDRTKTVVGWDVPARRRHGDGEPLPGAPGGRARPAHRGPRVEKVPETQGGSRFPERPQGRRPPPFGGEPPGSGADRGDERPEEILILGRHEVLAALDGDRPPESVFVSASAHGPGIERIRQAASRRHVKLLTMEPPLFRRRFGEAAQGVAARAAAFAYAELGDILAAAPPPGPAVVIALHGVEDARNLGAVVRTAEVAAARGVVIPKHRSAGMTEWAVRTSQGAAAYLPVARVTNLARALEELKEAGFLVVGLEAGAPDRYDQVAYPDRVALVVGGEDAGLGTAVAGVCDRLVGIPVLGRTRSLNLSVSTAVVLFEILRQRGFPGPRTA